jgi:hypothetical protein
VTDKSLYRLVHEVLDEVELERLRQRFGATEQAWPAVLDGIVAAAFAEYAAAGSDAAAQRARPLRLGAGHDDKCDPG